MKSVRIEYLELAPEINNSVIKIALNYPKYDDVRHCYLYELCYFEDIEIKIKQREEELLQYDVLTGDLSPFFLNISEKDYNDLEDYLTNHTEYEDTKLNDEISLLNAVINIYRNDPKSWET